MFPSTMRLSTDLRKAECHPVCFGIRYPSALSCRRPRVCRWFLGDYMGLTAIRDDLMAFFSVSTNTDDTADVLAVRANATP